MENDNYMEVDEAPIASTVYQERQVSNVCALNTINCVYKERVLGS